MNYFKPCHKNGILLYLLRWQEKEEIGPKKPIKLALSEQMGNR